MSGAIATVSMLRVPKVIINTGEFTEGGRGGE